MNKICPERKVGMKLIKTSNCCYKWVLKQNAYDSGASTTL